MPTITDFFGKASIDTDHSVATTITADRTSGVTVLNCFDLSTFTEDTPVYFVTYTKTTNPLTGEVTITDTISWKGLVNAGANTITNLTVAPGYVDTGNTDGQFVECIPTSYWANELVDGILVEHNQDGTHSDVTATSVTAATINATTDLQQNSVSLDTIRSEIISDFVSSGGVVAQSAGLVGTFSNIVYYIAGVRYTATSVANKTYTASKDTYVDINSSGTPIYPEVANGAASPALTSGYIRVAKVVTNGSAITSVTQNGQDSLGNNIYNMISYLPGGPAVSVVGTNESTSSTSPANLSTVQAVTVNIGRSGKALVSIAASINSSTTAQAAKAHFAVSGATTVAANDNAAIETQSIFATCARTYLVTGLNAGLNTFTMQFWVSASSTGTFRRRSLSVIPL